MWKIWTHKRIQQGITSRARSLTFCLRLRVRSKVDVEWELAYLVFHDSLYSLVLIVRCVMYDLISVILTHHTDSFVELLGRES